MTAPTNVEVHEETKGLFTSLAAGDPDLLAAGLGYGPTGRPEAASPPVTTLWSSWPR